MPFDPNTSKNTGPRSDLRPGNGLYALMLNGLKPFRYRSGVRVLLGLPDAQESPLFFLANLPPVGFRYVEAEAQVFPAGLATSGLTGERPSFQKKPYQINAALVSEIPALERGIPVLLTPSPFSGAVFQKLKTESGTNMPQQGETGLKMKTPPQAEMKSGVRSVQNTEQIKIDIPGKAESVRRFPAITPFQKEETEPSAGLQPQKPATGTLKTPSTWPGTRVVERAAFPQKTSNVELAKAENATGAVPFEGLSPHPKRASGMTCAKAGFAQIGVDGGWEKETVAAQPGTQILLRRVPAFGASGEGRVSPVASPPSRDAAESPARKFQGSNQAVEAHIQQLRQSVSERKVKTEDKGRAAAPESECRETTAPPAPEPTAPVVYLRKPAPQSALPPAFLERSYLSRTFFRLRMFR